MTAPIGRQAENGRAILPLWACSDAPRSQAMHGCAGFIGHFIDDSCCGPGQILARRGSRHEPDLTVLLICSDGPSTPRNAAPMRWGNRASKGVLAHELHHPDGHLPAADLTDPGSLDPWTSESSVSHFQASSASGERPAGRHRSPADLGHIHVPNDPFRISTGALTCRIERATSSWTWARRGRRARSTSLLACDPQQSAHPGPGLKAASGYIDRDVTLSEDEGHGKRAPSRRSARWPRRCRARRLRHRSAHYVAATAGDQGRPAGGPGCRPSIRGPET